MQSFATEDIPAGTKTHVCFVATPNIYTSPVVGSPDFTILTKNPSEYTFFKSDTIPFSYTSASSHLAKESTFYVDFYPTTAPLWTYAIDTATSLEAEYDFDDGALAGWTSNRSLSVINTTLAAAVDDVADNTHFYWMSPAITTAGDFMRATFDMTYWLCDCLYGADISYLDARYWIIQDGDACNKGYNSSIWGKVLFADNLAVSRYSKMSSDYSLTLTSLWQGSGIGVRYERYLGMHKASGTSTDTFHCDVAGSQYYQLEDANMSREVSPVFNVSGTTSSVPAVRMCIDFGKYTRYTSSLARVRGDNFKFYVAGGEPTVWDPTYGSLAVDEVHGLTKRMKQAAIEVTDAVTGTEATTGVPEEICSISYANQLETGSISEEFSRDQFTYLAGTGWQYIYAPSADDNRANEFGYYVYCEWPDDAVTRTFTSSFASTTAALNPAYLFGVSNTIKLSLTDDWMVAAYPGDDPRITGDNPSTTVTGNLVDSIGGAHALTFTYAPSTKTWNSAATFDQHGTWTLTATSSPLGYVVDTTVITFTEGLTYTGTVKNADTGAVIGRASISVYDISGTLVGSAESAVDGTYSVVLTAGTYTFDATKTGYQDYEGESVALTGGGALSDIEMEPEETYMLSVHLSDSEGGSPLPGLSVEASNAWSSVLTSAITDEDGIAYFALLPGIWSISIAPDTYGAISDSVDIIDADVDRYYSLTHISSYWQISSPVIDLAAGDLVNDKTENYKKFTWTPGGSTITMEYFNIPVYRGGGPATINNISVKVHTTVAGVEPFVDQEIYSVGGVESSTCSFTTTPSIYPGTDSAYVIRYFDVDDRFYLQGYDSATATLKFMDDFGLVCDDGESFYVLFDMLKYGSDSLPAGWKTSYIYSAIGHPIKVESVAAVLVDPAESNTLYAIVNNPAETLATYTTLEVGAFFYIRYPASSYDAVLVNGDVAVAVAPTACTFTIGASPPIAATIVGNHAYGAQAVVGTPASVALAWSCTFAQASLNTVGTATLPVAYAAFEEAYAYASPFEKNVGGERDVGVSLKPYTYFPRGDGYPTTIEVPEQLTDLTVVVYQGLEASIDPVVAPFVQWRSDLKDSSIYNKNTYFNQVVGGTRSLFAPGTYDAELAITGIEDGLFGISTMSTYTMIKESVSGSNFVAGETYSVTEAKTGEEFGCGMSWEVSSDPSVVHATFEIEVVPTDGTLDPDSKTMDTEDDTTQINYSPGALKEWARDYSTVGETLVYKPYGDGQYAAFYYHPKFGEGFPKVEGSGMVRCTITIDYGEYEPYVKTITTTYTFDADEYAVIGDGDGTLASSLGGLLSTPGGLVVVLVFGSIIGVILLILVAVAMKMS